MAFITRKTVSATFLERIHASATRVAYQFKPTHAGMGEPNAWRKVTFREFHNDARLVSFGLMGLGVLPGDRVVILSSTRYEWSLCDIAILGAAGVTVPIYPSNTPHDVEYIATHCEAKVLILEDATQLQKILTLRHENPAALPHVKKIVALEPTAVRFVVDTDAKAAQLSDVLTLQALFEVGRREESRDPTRFERNLGDAKPTDLLTICYTSGTTGVPKGVMLTHDNMVSVYEDAIASFGRFINHDDEIVLSFLPTSHILGKCEAMLIWTFGWTQAYAENIDKLMTNIGEVRPTILVAVPRIFEKAYNRITAMVAEGSGTKRKLFAWGLESGRRYHQAIWDKKLPRARDFVEYQAASRLVFSKIQRRFGGRLRFAICGGAPLPKEIAEFFQIVGIKILEGYGLTETSAPVSINDPSDIRFGTVGKPLPEVTIKIAEDGEILIKSRKVFLGYYKNPEETARALVDGWFHTGDIGFIDDDGFIHITDRKKDIIVTSAGKNVAPQKIENLAKANPIFNQFVVIGDRRNYLTAVATLDSERIIKYASENEILFSEYSELIHHPRVLAQVQHAIDDINLGLASFETIKKFVILPTEFTVEAGEITPSLKVRRNVITKKYRAEIDSMYESGQ